MTLVYETPLTPTEAYLMDYHDFYESLNETEKQKWLSSDKVSEVIREAKHRNDNVVKFPGVE